MKTTTEPPMSPDEAKRRLAAAYAMLINIARERRAAAAQTAEPARMTADATDRRANR